MKPILALAVTAVVCAPSSTSFAQEKKLRARSIGIARLIRHRKVLKELKLTDEQRKKLEDASAVARKATHAAAELKGEARRKKARAATKALRETIAATLDEKQSKRLLQIELQYSTSSWIVARKDVAELLDLSREQKKKIRELSRKTAEEVRKLRESQNDGNKQQTQRDVAKKLAAAHKAALAELSEEQMKKWKAAMGESFQLPRGKRKKKKKE